MSVSFARAVRDKLRAYGVVVHEYVGWESRGNGQTSNYQGGLMHHTASSYGMAYSGLVNGRPDLSGPLCNSAGNHDGSITMIAAHPANHAGASGGRSMGPLPTTRSFNKLVWGHEIVYPGDKPMTNAQYKSMIILGKVLTEILGRSNAEWIRGHGETSITGKWDPGYAPSKMINMTQVRSDINNFVAGGDNELVKNLVLGKAPDGAVYVGDGITRRHVADTNELTGLRHWIKLKGGDDTVHPFNDLRVLGEDVSALVESLTDDEGKIIAAVSKPVPVQIDYERFVADVVDRLAVKLSTLRFDATP